MLVDNWSKQNFLGDLKAMIDSSAITMVMATSPPLQDTKLWEGC